LGGFDSYDVGHTLGAGGNALYTNQFWFGGAFSRYEILEAGPLRSVFRLIYDTIRVDNTYYAETMTITSDAGSILNKGVVSYQGAEQAIQLATGIFMHGDSVNIACDKVYQTLSYTLNTVTNKGVRKGQTFIGIYAPGGTSRPFVQDKHYAVLNDYKTGDELTYYFGGTWSGWKVPTEQDWLTALAHFSQAKRTPLVVNINK
jgi:hypothetical protein